MLDREVQYGEARNRGEEIEVKFFEGRRGKREVVSLRNMVDSGGGVTLHLKKPRGRRLGPGKPGRARDSRFTGLPFSAG
jgi:hypothetical protein